MPFDPLAYRQRLNQALGRSLPGQSPEIGQPAMPGMPSLMDAGGGMDQLPSGPAQNRPPFTDAGEGPFAEQGSEPQTIDGAPTAGAPMGKPSKQGPSKIPTMPKGIKFDESKLTGVKTAGDLVDAMKPASQKKYMEWWEQQHGAIDKKWDDVEAQLGKRPDGAKGPMSRKEKFKMLMEFGLNLMKHSQAQGDRTPSLVEAGAGALHDTVRGAQQSDLNDQAQYDATLGEARKRRGEEQKTIGTYGDAMKGQSAMDQDEAQITEANARTKKVDEMAPDVESSDDGMMQWNPGKKAYEPLTIDGKRQTNAKVGARGGSGASNDSRTAQIKNIDDLVKRGVPEQLATDIVYKRVTDPRKAFTDIVRDRMRAYASRQEAEKDANDIISGLFGEDWKTKPVTPKMESTDDPLGLR